jgi:pimeloyl-ACP methyl ester carboxylesterase
LRRGILHNAEQLDDGTWVWRYQRHREIDPEQLAFEHPDYRDLWDVVSQIRVPLLLARGMREGSVVADEDEVELLRRLPDARVEHFADAGHSLQGDTPVELARAIERFVFG